MASSITRAVLDFAKHILGHDITPRNNTTKAVLDAFLDDVAGHDVDTRGMGVPEIIDTITANYDGGGGGGADVGAPVAVIVEYNEPTVGSGDPGGAYGPHTVAIGDAVIGIGDIPGIGIGYLYGSFAAGMTAQTMSYEEDTLSAYACTIGDDGEGNAVYLTVAPYALEATRTSGDSGYSWTFVIPEMNEGVALVLYPHTAD